MALQSSKRREDELMKSRVSIVAAVLLMVIFTAFVGCEQQKTVDKKPATTVTKDYPLEGQVVEIAEDRMAVTIDHKEIPDLMKAMKMEFKVKDTGLLEGIEPGDKVQGRVKAEGGEYIITSLQEQ
jgi:Cu/Ag efflux protein CusF